MIYLYKIAIFHGYVTCWFTKGYTMVYPSIVFLVICKTKAQITSIAFLK